MSKILLCSDGSAYGQVCCQYGSWILSRLTQAQLDILYVSDLRQYEVPLIADLSGSLGIQPYQSILSQLEDLEGKKAAALLEAAQVVFADAGQADRVNTHHTTGLLIDSLREFEEPYDLILLGKRGENADFAKEHIGSTIERVVRASHKPCLVTSRNFRPIEKVALAFDGGDSCYKALHYLTNSGLFKGLEIYLVTVPEDKGEDFALHHLREAEELLKHADIHPVCQMLPGVSEDVISSYVDESGIHLLMMGAYGHSRIRQLLIGSTTTEMIRRCKIPVMLFR
ncbi:MAG: universal stress protein [Verrucomicrobia bacterium]|nr:universal stress protein [Verrucomicrobiota bacterium]